MINNNISNVDTPEYKTMDVSFSDLLEKQTGKESNSLNFHGYRSNEKHFVIGQPDNDEFNPRIILQNKTSVLNNANNVDIDLEMTKLAENEIWHNTLTELVNKNFSMLSYVITEGKG